MARSRVRHLPETRPGILRCNTQSDPWSGQRAKSRRCEFSRAARAQIDRSLRPEDIQKYGCNSATNVPHPGQKNAAGRLVHRANVRTRAMAPSNPRTQRREDGRSKVTDAPAAGALPPNTGHPYHERAVAVPAAAVFLRRQLRCAQSRPAVKRAPSANRVKGPNATAEARPTK